MQFMKLRWISCDLLVEYNRYVWGINRAEWPVSLGTMKEVFEFGRRKDNY